MTGIFEREPGKRWPRAQKFRLSARGTEAESRYREGVAAARSDGGRASFDQARATWAAEFGIEPADGVCLIELLAGPRTMSELVTSLESCGSTRAEIRLSLTRLTEAQLVEPVPAEPAAAPPPRRW